MRFLLITLFAVIHFSTPVLAAAEIGKALPTNLALPGQNGVTQNYDGVKGEKGAVLIFVRSADWCPYCQVQLLDLKDKAAEIEEQGYNIVTVSYDSPELLGKFATKYKFPYTMLSDEGSETIRAFGIFNEDFAPDHFAYGVPHPTIYVVSADGVVQAILAEENYKKRPQAEAILEAIQTVGH